MVAKKKAIKKTTRKMSSVVASEAMTSEMTTDTKTIIVVLLLIFVYPIGAIFMWVWMKWWPKWLRILLTIPFAIAVLGIIFAFAMAGFIVKHGMQEQNKMDYQRRMYAPMKQQNQFYLSPTPATYSNY